MRSPTSARSAEYGCTSTARTACPRQRRPTSAALFAGLDRVDSLSVDAHKWMFVPKACSAVLVRRTADLAAVFSHDEAYIPHEDDALNAVDVTLEYSRPLRALKLWLALRVHGAQAFRAAIEGNLAQAQLLYGLAAAHPDFQTREHPPQLSHRPDPPRAWPVAPISTVTTTSCAARCSATAVSTSRPP